MGYWISHISRISERTGIDSVLIINSLNTGVMSIIATNKISKENIYYRSKRLERMVQNLKKLSLYCS